MNNCLPPDCTTDAGGGKTERGPGTQAVRRLIVLILLTAATDADGGKTAPAAGTQVVRRLIVVMLLIAAALDLTRCGLVMAAARP